MKKTGLTAFALFFAMMFSVAGMAACEQAPSEQPNNPGDPPDTGTLDRDFPYIDDADDAPIQAEIPFDDSVKYSYTNAFRTVSGNISVSEGVYTAQYANSMAVDNTTAFPYGTISCTVRSNNTNDSGIVFGLTENGASSYWESGVSYYFFFLGQGGNAYLGKVDGGWSALKVVSLGGAIDSTRDYSVKVVLKSNKICCYVDGVLMFGYKDENFLTGTCYGIRAGAAGVTFSNVTVTNEYDYE